MARLLEERVCAAEGHLESLVISALTENVAAMELERPWNKEVISLLTLKVASGFSIVAGRIQGALCECLPAVVMV